MPFKLSVIFYISPPAFRKVCCSHNFENILSDFNNNAICIVQIMDLSFCSKDIISKFTYAFPLQRLLPCTLLNIPFQNHILNTSLSDKCVWFNPVLKKPVTQQTGFEPYSWLFVLTFYFTTKKCPSYNAHAFKSTIFYFFGWKMARLPPMSQQNWKLNKNGHNHVNTKFQ